MRNEVDRLKEDKVNRDDWELSNFNINERIDNLEKLIRATQTDASTAINDRQSDKSSALDEQAIKDLLDKLAALQKQVNDIGASLP